MKTKLLFGALLAGSLLLNAEANAQSISVGPRLGVNFSHVAFTDGDDDYIEYLDDDQENLTGLHLGAVVNIGLNEMLSVQPEILFSQKGTRYAGDHDYWRVDYENTHTRNYLEIPILVKATFGSEDLNAFVNAGPYVGFLIGGKDNYILGGNESEAEMDFKYRNGVRPNRNDVGLAVGAGLGTHIGPGNLGFEVRYGMGLSDLNQYREDRDPDWPKYQNRTLGVSVSYLIPLK